MDERRACALAGSNRFYVKHVIGGAPNVRDRDAEFAARGNQAKAEVLGVWRDVTAEVADVFGGLTADRLTHLTSDRNRSVAEVLLHVTHHNACTSAKSGGSPSCDVLA